MIFQVDPIGRSLMSLFARSFVKLTVPLINAKILLKKENFD